MADNLVLLQVPAADGFVLADGEKVRVARADRQAAHRANVAGEGKLERAGGQVPDLDGPVCRAYGGRGGATNRGGREDGCNLWRCG